MTGRPEPAATRAAPEPSSRRIPRPRWVLIVALFAMFVAVLATNGLVSSQIGIDATGAGPEGPDGLVPDSISAGGPVIDLTRGRTDSHVLPPKTVALSFDDGPDPQWTPEVLAELEKYHVPGTFFVVGSRVARYPQLARDILASGSQIGLHTFTHPDLSETTPSRIDREFTANQLTLAGATGQMSYLVRPPYSSEPSALDNGDYAVLQHLGRQGYVTAVVDVDSEDWTRPGVSAIVANVDTTAQSGGVVLLHDAGGDRSETVAALDQIIPTLQREGVTFTTVTGGAGLPSADFPANPAQLTMGKVLLGAVSVAAGLVDALQWSLVLGGGLVMLRLILMLVVARRHQRRRSRQAQDPLRQWPDPVSVVVPAYNEKSTIAATVRSLLAGTHPIEIIVVDDGSTDGTAAAVEQLGLPGVRVIRKPNGGKPSALNAGIAAASHEIIVMIDGDTIFEPTTVANLAAPFTDPQVGAVAGNARVGDRRSVIAQWQHIEYVIGFNIDRRVQDSWRAVTTVPGAVGAFRRAALEQAGGVSEDTLAEDTDLTIAIGRAGWLVRYEPTARAWTDAPSTFGQLWRQRYRWSFGVMQSLWKHRAAVFESGPSGRIGRRGLLMAALFQIVLPLIAPLIDIYLVYGVLFLDPTRTAVLWTAALVLQMIVGAVAFRLEGEPLRGLALLPLQQLVYRQLMYAVLIHSVVSAVSGSRLRWQKIPRAGSFSAAPRSLTAAVAGNGVSPAPPDATDAINAGEAR